ncbi:hypothetical protein AX17_006840 [Amanita inopinata Kibby_2008]|nr:hypothetical protein AX17_006840 [Amanita inopinata Kibby_2008]
MGDHDPLDHPNNPSGIPDANTPIQLPLGITAIRVYQDGSTEEQQEHITTAAHLVAKSFLDGDAVFILAISSIDSFLNNYLFNSFDDRVAAYQDSSQEFLKLGYSIAANGFVHHNKLTRSLSPLPTPPTIFTSQTPVTPLF